MAFMRFIIRVLSLTLMIVGLNGASTTLQLNPRGAVVTAPALVLRGIFAGWVVEGGTPALRSRDIDTWEVRIALDGRTQEARGWKAQDGFLPVIKISPREVRHF